MTNQLTKAGPKDPRQALEARYAELQASEGILRAERAKATLDGDTASAAALREVTDGMEAVMDALSALDQEEREKAAKKAARDEKASRTRFNNKVRELLEKRTAAINDAEAAARSFVRAVRVAEEMNTDLRSELNAREMTVPAGLGAHSQIDLFSRGLAAIIQSQLGGPRFGEMALKPGMRDAVTPWADIDKNTTTTLTEVMEMENG